MSYVGTIDKSVSCIYGTFNIKIDKEVPMLFAVKFPQYVKYVKDPEPVVQEIIEETEVQIKERKGKNS